MMLILLRSHHSPPLFASRPVTRLKLQEAPEDEVQSITYAEICYTPKELLKFIISLSRNPGDMCENDY